VRNLRRLLRLPLRKTSWPETRWLWLGSAVGLVILLGIAVWPAYGEPTSFGPSPNSVAHSEMLGSPTPTLSALHVVPRQVQALPESGSAARRSSDESPQPTRANPAPRPTTGPWVNRSELELKVGFEVLEPTSLPSGCTPLQRSVEPVGPSQVVNMAYSCVHILEQAVHIDQRPYVGPSSTQEVTVGGRPAVYVDGAWWQDLNKGSDSRWRSGWSQLLFIRDGVFFILDELGGHQSRDQLIRIAESLR
jgi:hypothetical protein